MLRIAHHCSDISCWWNGKSTVRHDRLLDILLSNNVRHGGVDISWILVR
nr:MAG TPA: protein of unknown function (DUF5579) [Caudoviricetes sp.]